MIDNFIMNVIVYKTTNRVNGKVYVGIHETADPSSFDGYLGSGKLLMRAVRKYGKDAFQREILFTCDDINEALELEALIVDREFLLRENVYNVTIGGGIPPSFKGKKRNPSSVRKLVETRKAKIASGEISLENFTFRGHKHTFESKKKSGDKIRGLFAGEKNYFYNKKFRGKLNHKFGKHFRWVNDGSVEKQIDITIEMPTGFVVGRLPKFLANRQKDSKGRLV